MFKGLAVLVVAACGGPSAAPDAPPMRQLTADVTIDASGLSEPVTFVVPDHTRSITVVATGSDGALYALGSYVTADGIDHVGLDPATPPGPAMLQSYNVEQVGEMSGSLFQSIRLGTFTHVYPYRPDQTAIAGVSSLRIASDQPGPVHVTVLLPEDDGGKVLHINVIVVSETLTLPQPPTFVAALQEVFGQVGIEVVVDSTLTLRGTGLSAITQSTEPQEAPASMSARLPGLVVDQIGGSAVDVFVVDSLPSGIAGLSLGTPGPPVHGSYYDGVIVEHLTPDATQAIVVAHETCHFMALQHVTNVGASGRTYPDPLDDTNPGQMNLMEDGSRLTPDQGFALSRSALLQPQ